MEMNFSGFSSDDIELIVSLIRDHKKCYRSFIESSLCSDDWASSLEALEQSASHLAAYVANFEDAFLNMAS